MARKRRRFTAEFKARVALEALRERVLIPTQIVHSFRRMPSTHSDANRPPGCVVIAAVLRCRRVGVERVGRGAG